MIKCRPPGNRNPSRTKSRRASRSCSGRSTRSTEGDRRARHVRGAGAARDGRADLALARPGARFRDGAKLIPTFHPAFLLRSPERKRDVWEDMKKVP